MTRILHVVECYGAGVGRAVQLWAKLTPEHEHHLLWEGEESPVDETAFSSETQMPSGFSARIAAVRTRVRAVRADVVIAHSSWAGVYARARRLSVPVIYAPHAYKFEDSSETSIRRTIYRAAEALLIRRSRMTLALTPHEESLARSLNSSRTTYLVPNSPTVTPRDGGKATGFDTGETVLMIGRVSRQKDPAYFIEVARILRRTQPHIRFVWAGDGDPDLMQDLHDAGVRVTGWLARDELIKLLSEPAVYFHSAIYEGFPLSVLDAAAFEHPIVVRAIPPFNGLELLSVGSATEAAHVILSVFDGASGRQEAIRGARSVTALMNRDAQTCAMRSVMTHLLPSSDTRCETATEEMVNINGGSGA